VDVNLDQGQWQFGGAGGDGEQFSDTDVQFQVRRGVIVPYFDIKFEVSDQHSPIRMIALGPKNPNGSGNVRFLLGNNGYKDIDLAAAGSAYR
jgi:hypothetical protein